MRHSLTPSANIAAVCVGPITTPIGRHRRRHQGRHGRRRSPRASTSTTTRGRTPTAGCRSSTTKWQEEKYTEAVMSVTDRLQSKLQAEMASRIASDLSTPPLLWDPWLYYRRVEEGKQFPELCRRLASLNDEFISHKSPSSGFDFTSGKRIEQKLIDYNQESQRCGGYAYEELSKVSPDPRFIAYTMYDKEADLFRLSVRNLNSGGLCGKPKADPIWSIRIYCSAIGSTDDDVLILEEPDEEVYVNIQHIKDFHFVTVSTFSTMSSKFQANPLSGVNLVWECNGIAHGILEHHQGFLYLFTDAAKADQSVDYHYLLRSPLHSSSKNMGVILREGRNFKLCSVTVPLPAGKDPVHLKELHPQFLPLPKYVMQISPGPNYDYHSPVMRFTISSPLLWKDLSEFYACEQYNVFSYDGVLVPLTVVKSRKKQERGSEPWIASCPWSLREIVHENKLAGWGHSAGGPMVASAINQSPYLFKAAILKFPFLDATNTLHSPILPLTAADYEEFGYPGDIDDFHAIRDYSPYDNIQKDVLFPAVMISSSFNTRFGDWESAKWISLTLDFAFPVRSASVHQQQRS
ncbi:hypothetical protein C1H46_018515 [Malus baccata]|uniref:Prolyl endopeptidase n=1 Tax=Malus baccata TaxID=106549 RepID=A0A540MAV9_MALBA|nr:hypothetical protein C1H46_018515 [Malus baccata]